MNVHGKTKGNANNKEMKLCESKKHAVRDYEVSTMKDGVPTLVEKIHLIDSR